MTREEAITILNMVEAHGSLVIQAKEMAIQALEQEPMRDATPEERESVDAYIKSISKPTGITFEQADGDLISRIELLKAIDTWDKFGCDADTKLVPYKDHYIPYIHYDDVVKCIKGMPSVDIPPEHDGCKDCVYQDNPQDAMPCRECKQNYLDKWKAIPSAEPYKGMTNGEVIKMVFPDIPRTLEWHIQNVTDDDWWNSPYEPQESSDHNLKMWHDIYAEEKRREGSDKE